MKNKEKLDQIYESIQNGQKKQAAEQIKEYGPEFWKDCKDYLVEMSCSDLQKFYTYTELCITYNRSQK